MRYFFLIFQLLGWNLVFSQSTLQVDYTFYMNLGIPRTDTWTFFSNKNENLFLLKSSIQKEFQKNGNEEYIEIKLKAENGFTQHIIQNLESDSIYSQGLVMGKSYYVFDKLYKQNWSITEETKKINDYNCYKATTSFRGRNYIAWFTPELACKAGPWKFNNLPGLILELYDTSKKIIITAIKIENNNTNINELIKNIPKLGAKTSFKD